MKKVILIVLSVMIVLVVSGIAFIWYQMQLPLYEPGMVRAGENLRAPLDPPAQPADPEIWRVERDIDLYHFSEGRGRNVLVVHGGPGMPFDRAWPSLAPFTDEYEFHYYDQRGCGSSTRPIREFSSSNYYENMTALDRALGLGAQIADIERIRSLLGDARLILIGHSWGGFLSALYAAEFPENVSALVLISPADVLVMPQERDLFDLIRRRLPADMHADYDAFMREYFEFGDIFAKSEEDLIAVSREFGKYYRMASKADLPEQNQPGGWMVYAMYFSMGQRHDYREALGALEAPVLVIHGADDIQSEEATRSYVDAFPNARIEVIEDAGHFSFREQPERFFQSVAKFLRGLDDGP